MIKETPKFTNSAQVRDFVYALYCDAKFDVSNRCIVISAQTYNNKLCDGAKELFCKEIKNEKPSNDDCGSLKMHYSAERYFMNNKKTRVCYVIRCGEAEYAICEYLKRVRKMDEFEAKMLAFEFIYSYPSQISEEHRKGKKAFDKIIDVTLNR